MTSVRSKGGMNLPDVRLYYYASLLDQIKHWFVYSNDKLWLNIEHEIVKGNNLFTLDIAYYLIPKVNIPNYLTLKSTLTAWKFILTKLQPISDLVHVPLPIGTIEYCKAWLNVTPWTKQGTNFLNLPDAQKTRFSNKLNSKPYLKNCNPKMNMEIPRVIWDFFSSSKVKNRGISLFYKLISSFPPKPKTSNLIKWENDLS